MATNGWSDETPTPPRRQILSSGALQRRHSRQTHSVLPGTCLSQELDGSVLPCSFASSCRPSNTRWALTSPRPLHSTGDQQSPPSLAGRDALERSFGTASSTVGSGLGASSDQTLFQPPSPTPQAPEQTMEDNQLALPLGRLRQGAILLARWRVSMEARRSPTPKIRCGRLLRPTQAKDFRPPQRPSVFFFYYPTLLLVLTCSRKSRWWDKLLCVPMHVR